MGPRTPPPKNPERSKERTTSPGLEEALRERYARMGAALLADDAPRRLDPCLRTEMETITGADLSDVRIHTGGEARQMASTLGARAFAAGPSDVFFARDQFAPATPQGKSLLAHELTHVAEGEAGMADEPRLPEREKLEMRARRVEKLVLAQEQAPAPEASREPVALELPGVTDPASATPGTVQIDRAALEEKVWKLLQREMKRQRERTGNR